VRAPSPVGELGNVEMTQALTLLDTAWQGVGPDMLLTGARTCHLCSPGFLEAWRGKRPDQCCCIVPS
jgi:hypothetical protein